MIDTEVREKLFKILNIIQDKLAYEHIQPKGSNGIIELGY